MCPPQQADHCPLSASQIGAAFLKNVYSVFRASPASVGFALLAGANSTNHGLVYNGTLIGNHTNATNIPTGIYGPSGVDSSAPVTSTVMAITTAIQAGQSASTTAARAGTTSGAGRVQPEVLRLGATMVAVLGAGIGWWVV